MSVTYQPILDFITRLKKLDEMNMTIESAVFVYIGIDLMAILGKPVSENRQTRTDFKQWVNKYMIADPEQPYQYSPEDVYAARCSLLHNYSSEAEIHADGSAKKFGYSDGGKHFYDSSVSNELVIIGSKSLVDDFVRGVENYFQDATEDQELKTRIESRVSKVFGDFTIL